MVPGLGRRCQLHRAGLALADPYVESFNARVRDELLDVELFSSLAEARVLAEEWRLAYNEEHPHSALGMVTPSRFAASWQKPGSKTEQPPRTLMVSGPMKGVRSKALARENKKLRRANEILKSASAFFAKKLDPDRPK